MWTHVSMQLTMPVEINQAAILESKHHRFQVHPMLMVLRNTKKEPPQQSMTMAKCQHTALKINSVFILKYCDDTSTSVVKAQTNLYSIS